MGLVRGSVTIERQGRQNTVMRKKTVEEMETDKRRCGKWIMMVRKMQLGEKVSEKDVKRRARKGIPDGVRGSAWPTLCQSSQCIPSQYSKNFVGKQSWMKTLLN